MEFEFGGVKGNFSNEVKLNWEEVTTDYLQTIKVYQHEEEELNHYYRYAIQVIDMDSACGESGFEVIAYYIVDFESLTHKHKKSISESYGHDAKDFDESFVNAYDLIAQGCSVQLAHKHVDNEEDVDNAIHEGMAFCETVDGMRGFYLDRSWNRIGTTGWDVISYAIGKRENLFDY